MGDAAAKEKGRAKRGPFFGYLVVLTLVVTSFVEISLVLSCVGIFYPPVSDYLGVGRGILSYYSSFLSLGSVLTLPLMGRMLAKLDARICVSGAILVIGLDFIWLAFTDSLVHFYLGGLVAGAAMGMLLFLAPSTLVNRWFSKRAGFFVGLIMAFTGVGGTVFSAVGGVLIDSIGWSATYLVFGAISLATLPLGIFCIASRPSDKGLVPYGSQGEPQEGERAEEELRDASQGPQGNGSGQHGEAASVGKAMRTPVFFLVLAVGLILNMGFYAYVMIPSYVTTLPIGLEMPLLGATASSVAMAGQTISKLVLGAAGERRPYAATIIAIAIGLVGLTLFSMPGITAVVVYAAAFAFGVYYGIPNVMMPLITRHNFGDENYPQIYSRISMGAAIGGLCGPLLWGTLIELTGNHLVMFGGVFAVLTIAAVIVALIPRVAARRVG